MLNASSTAPIHAKGLVAMDSDRTAGWEWTQCALDQQSPLLPTLPPLAAPAASSPPTTTLDRRSSAAHLPHKSMYSISYGATLSHLYPQNLHRHPITRC